MWANLTRPLQTQNPARGYHTGLNVAEASIINKKACLRSSVYASKQNIETSIGERFEAFMLENARQL
jgi:hypothetical protein